jgi:hypothetical protein
VPFRLCAGAGERSPRRLFSLTAGCGIAFAMPLCACQMNQTAQQAGDRPPAPPPATAAVSDTAADSLELELALPARLRTADPVPITLRLRNRTTRPLDLYLRGRTATFDVVVTDPDGAVVWRRLEAEIIPAIVHLRTLAPAEQLLLETRWDQRANDGKQVAAGEYTARGLLLVEGDPLETRPVPFRIDPH